MEASTGVEPASTGVKAQRLYRLPTTPCADAERVELPRTEAPTVFETATGAICRLAHPDSLDSRPRPGSRSLELALTSTRRDRDSDPGALAGHGLASRCDGPLCHLSLRAPGASRTLTLPRRRRTLGPSSCGGMEPEHGIGPWTSFVPGRRSSRLSYTGVASTDGLEPPTYASGGQRSVHLSYAEMLRSSRDSNPECSSRRAV
jgi:hypothetical protein